MLSAVVAVLFWGVLTGCAAQPGPQRAVSPCELAPASYDCQVERYQTAPG